MEYGYHFTIRVSFLSFEIKKKKKYIYIYIFFFFFLAALGLVAVHGLSLVVASGGYSICDTQASVHGVGKSQTRLSE